MMGQQDTQLWDEHPMHKNNIEYEANAEMHHQLCEDLCRINDLQGSLKELEDAVKRAQTIKELRKLTAVLQKKKAELQDAIKRAWKTETRLALERIHRRHRAITELLNKSKANQIQNDNIARKKLANPAKHCRTVTAEKMMLEKTDLAAKTSQRCGERKEQQKRSCDVYLRLKHKLRQTYKKWRRRQKEAEAAQERMTEGQQKTTRFEDKQVEKAHRQNQAALDAFLQFHDAYGEEITTYPQYENRMRIAKGRQTRANKQPRDTRGRFV